MVIVGQFKASFSEEKVSGNGEKMQRNINELSAGHANGHHIAEGTKINERFRHLIRLVE